MTEHFTQAGMKELAGDIGISFYPRYFSDKNLTDLCNAAVNHKLKEWEAQEPVAFLCPQDDSLEHAGFLTPESEAKQVPLYTRALPTQPVNAEFVAVAWKHEYFDHAVFQESCPRYPESGWFRLYAALANAKAAPATIVERYALRPRWVTSRGLSAHKADAALTAGREALGQAPSTPLSRFVDSSPSDREAIGNAAVAEADAEMAKMTARTQPERAPLPASDHRRLPSCP